MVVDNAIVVIENIFTHMQQGKTRLQAATAPKKLRVDISRNPANVAAFAPPVLVEGEVAQLFADMAITITAAAVLSMFASLTLVPMLSGCFSTRQRHSRCPAETTVIATGLKKRSRGHRQLFDCRAS